jgi:hypothetical protein
LVLGVSNEASEPVTKKSRTLSPTNTQDPTNQIVQYDAKSLLGMDDYILSFILFFVLIDYKDKIPTLMQNYGSLQLVCRRVKKLIPESLRQFGPHLSGILFNATDCKYPVKYTKILISIVNPNTFTDFDGSSLLHRAVENENEEAVNALINAGANPNTFDKEMDTPLHLAATTGIKSIAVILLNAKSKPNAVNLRGMSPLALAIEAGHKKCAQALVDHYLKNNIKIPENLITPLRELGVNTEPRALFCLVQ